MWVEGTLAVYEEELSCLVLLQVDNYPEQPASPGVLVWAGQHVIAVWVSVRVRYHDGELLGSWLVRRVGVWCDVVNRQPVSRSARGIPEVVEVEIVAVVCDRLQPEVPAFLVPDLRQ